MEDAAEQLDKLALSVGECVRCQGLVAQRLRAVPGGGHPHCAVMIVSLDPAPADEAEGQPAGATLVKQLSEFMPALSAAADKVYVTTLVKCVARTAGATRPPEPEELDNCFPYLSTELSITTPHYILTVGEQATRYMLHKLFKDQPYRDGDSLELRVFDNPAFRIVPIADPEELRARDADERAAYCERLGKLSHLMGI